MTPFYRPDLAHNLLAILTSMPRAKIFKLTNDLKNEIQTVAIVRALNKIFVGQKITRDAQEHLLKQLIHGTPGDDGVIGEFEKLVRGNKIYNNLFEEATFITTGTNEAVNKLKLKSVFHRDERLNVLFGEGEIGLDEVNKTYLDPTGPVLAARSASTKAKAALKNMKVAIAFGVKFLNSDGSLPSGTDKDAYFEFVLKRMYEHMNKKQKTQLMMTIQKNDCISLLLGTFMAGFHSFFLAQWQMKRTNWQSLQPEICLQQQAR